MPFMRGAIPAPHLLAATPPFVPSPFLSAPTNFVVIPPRLDIWGNSTFGCCVTSEEAFAKAAYSVLYGVGNELFVDAQTMIAWAGRHGVLHGATLTGVMNAMARDGMDIGGANYKDGPYTAVDWTNAAALSQAIYQGPVKIAVASNQLERSHSHSNGWIGTGYRRDRWTDHCVSLCGYGEAGWLAEQFKVKLSGGLAPTARAYGLFTWGSIGIVDEPSMIAITDEAYVRNPTTLGFTPPNPNPAPNPNPTPTPIPGTGGAFTVVNGGLEFVISYRPINPVPLPGEEVPYA